ncbi:hypothetical protein B7494_g608 [Chlorociboria aeruginascens]|nr:hypothetical protein B7494_g608 [Chlorociboria aeruginascens]
MAIPASNRKVVLITGVNGYIASVLGQLLLTNGYTVRGTTRRVASTEPLLNGPWAAYKDRVQIYEVPDMTVDGAFDEAVKGVDGIFHTASPIDFTIDTYDKMAIPAVRGSQNLLESALKAGPQLTSVVVTSSVAAIVDPPPVPEFVFTEAHFASVALNEALKDKEEGKSSPAPVLYAASKTAADRAVFAFKNERKPSFAISTINPSIVIGPPVFLPSSGAKLNTTLKPLFEMLSGDLKTIPPITGSGGFVDVRDVVKMHVWAYENSSKADGERYIVCGGFGAPQAAADLLREKYRGTKIGEKITLGNPGEGYLGYDKETGKVNEVLWLPGSMRLDGSKAEKAMGFEYITLPQSINDTADVLEALL